MTRSIEVGTKSAESEGTPQVEEIRDAVRLEKADKSTKDSKKVKLGESGGITF